MSLNQFFSIPSDATIWGFLNSNALAALLGAYLTYALTVLTGRTKRVEREAEKANEVADDAEEALKAYQQVEIRSRGEFR